MSININLSDISLALGEDNFLEKYDQVVDDTVIPFLAQAGFRPDDGEGNADEFTDMMQTVLTWMCMKSERFEKTLFAALHDHIRALAVQSDYTGVALVCNECGEAFDDLIVANEHATKYVEGELHNDFRIEARQVAF